MEASTPTSLGSTCRDAILSAADFEALLAPFGEEQIVFVDTTSASGGFLAPLAKKNRILVTSTKSGFERNESQFGGYFVEAYSGGADFDKNQRVSVLEAFEYARQKVDGYYAEENLLKTEHAQLDDDGDGKGIGTAADLTEQGGKKDGALAGAAYLMGNEAVAEGLDPDAVAADPELARLVESKRDSGRPGGSVEAPEGFDAGADVYGRARKAPPGARFGHPEHRGTDEEVRLRRISGLLLAVPALLVTASFASASLSDAETALRAGRYDEAIASFEKESVATPTAHLYRGWMAALRTVGRYDEALALVERFREREPASVELENRRGEILYDVGKIDEAREAFERAIEGGASDHLTAKKNLAVLLYQSGETDDALRRFDRFIDVYNQSSNLSAEDLTAVGIACRYLGLKNPQLYKDALRALDEAKAKDPADPDPVVLAGMLFLEKYNSPDANESFQEVLKGNPNHPEALLGLARVKEFDGDPEALDLTKKALEVNPNFVAARSFLAEQLLGLENYQAARKEVERALQVNPVSPDALPILAAAELLSGDEAAFRDVENRALARNPKDSHFYSELSDIAVNNRLYTQARDFAQKAVDLDPRSWEGYGQLGQNELRLGDIEDGQKNLARSFEGDPFNVWIKNTLDLLDTYPNYRTTSTGRFDIFIEGKESDLLSGYVEKIANEAYDKLSERYQYRPETPIRIELFPSHGDFSVRTLGLPGLGALGVCFGRVVVADSPSARPKGEFNWASTLWHELAHTVTLGATDHKIPRWFSEGLSVLEERRARPGWGDDVSLSFLAAYKRKKLLSIAELNNGFMRPTYPQQIVISYYQASLVSELIERDFGFQAIRDMLSAYREGLFTPDVFRKVLKMELSDFDARFDAYLKERFDAEAATLRLAPEPKEGEAADPHPVSMKDLEARAASDDFDFIAHLEVGRRALEAGNKEEAEKHLERAQKLVPDYAEAGSPYVLLSQIYEERGDLERAAGELQRFVDINENHYDAHVKLFEIYQKLGKSAEAAGILERAIYIYPFDPEAHRKLAELYRELGTQAGRHRGKARAARPDDRSGAGSLRARARLLRSRGPQEREDGAPPSPRDRARLQRGARASAEALGRQPGMIGARPSERGTWKIATATRDKKYRSEASIEKGIDP